MPHPAQPRRAPPNPAGPRPAMPSPTPQDLTMPDPVPPCPALFPVQPFGCETAILRTPIADPDLLPCHVKPFIYPSDIDE